MLSSGLPVQVRDHALGMKDDVPKSDVNKEFYTQNVEKEVRTTIGNCQLLSVPGGEGRGEGLKKKNVSKTPSYSRTVLKQLKTSIQKAFNWSYDTI